MMKEDLEIRKIPPRNIFELCQILEICDSWKELMVNIHDNNGKLKYNTEHVKLIESAADKQKRLCSEILFEEWGTSERRRPNVKYLKELLENARLFRASEYVTSKILHENIEEEEEEDNYDGLILTPTAPPISEASYNTINLQETVACGHIENSDIVMFNYHDLYSGTQGFSEELSLGSGGFGDVYLCSFTNGERIAVKRIKTKSDIPGSSGIQFRNELLAVSQISHENILPLVGYSCNGPELCLAYSYMVNGSLEDRLACKGGTNLLNWTQRYNIACGVARALVHLHTFDKKPLVHRDVKSANILLDEQFIPKLGDFGIARQGSNAQHTKTVAMTSTVYGTNAYMAPEAFRGDVSVKMDVFSFGVVLLELVTGLPPLDDEREGRDLASHVETVEDLNILIDKGIEPLLPLAEEMFDIANKCLVEKKSRPTMVTVLNLLELVKM